MAGTKKATVDPGKVDLNKIGVVEKVHQRHVEQRDMETGRIDAKVVHEKHTELHSLLDEKDALMLGLQTWHRFRMSKPGNVLYTCVINDRRFLVPEAVFQKMKDGGVAKEEGVE